MKEYEIGASEKRPWGCWSVEGMGCGFVVKKIIVNAMQELSLQAHSYRSEHWVILSGIADVTVGDKTVRRKVNDTIFIPQSSRHRIANPGGEPLVFIEIQIGDILDETDIERFEDRYGRVVTEVTKL